VVINNVKENKVKSTTIHDCLSWDIKASEPPESGPSTWSAGAAVPVRNLERLPESNRNISELTFGYDFVNVNFGAASGFA
jgi:hypothetical protein